MIVDGMVNFDSKEVTKRDAIQLTSATKVQMTALSKTKILLIETTINFINLVCYQILLKHMNIFSLI